MAWTRKTYTTSTSFVAPPGVKEIMLFGYGGGGGGGGGSRSDSNDSTERPGGGGGGGAADPVWARALVTPGTVYTVTVGAGGTGGLGRTTTPGNGFAGGSGANTTFGTLVTLFGAGGGSGGKYNSAPGTFDPRAGGRSYNVGVAFDAIDDARPPREFGRGGHGRNMNTGGDTGFWINGKQTNGSPHLGGVGGTLGADDTPRAGGGAGGGGAGGAGGIGGAGGDGGIGNSAGTGGLGVAGASTAANTGAGGGGGGAGGQGSTGGGDGESGGNGGSGLLVIYWWT